MNPNTASEWVTVSGLPAFCMFGVSTASATKMVHAVAFYHSSVLKTMDRIRTGYVIFATIKAFIITMVYFNDM